jgi:Glycosyltransferase family 87
MKRAVAHNLLWLVLVSILFAVGMWAYIDRVLIPHQISDAAAHDRPRGNLSDLYPRWIAARELLLHGRDPYGSDISREIQAGYYGRPLDPNRPGDPKDEQGFAYPPYVVFFLAPTVRLQFAIVQKCFFWVLVILTGVAIPIWLRILRWSAPLAAQISLVALTLGSVPVVQGLKLQQISLLVAGGIAIAVALLMMDRPIIAGMLLAFCTVKPQLVAILLIWLSIWTVANWRNRCRWVLSFLFTLAILLAASEWILPHWVPRFLQAVRDYQRYTGGMSILDALMGAPWSWGIELIVVSAVLRACWKERRQPIDSAAFGFIICLLLATTVLVIPSSSTYNQVLLLPALLLLIKERRAIWCRSQASRILFFLLAALIVWPWISGIVLAALSFFLPPSSFNRVWGIPVWMVTPSPVVVAAVMLVNYYQKTFTLSPTPRSS